MQRLYGSFVPAPGGVGLLILRLITGTALMLHGWPKMQHAFTWMDAFHPGMPGPLQALQVLIEVGGGLGLVLGLLTPLAATGVSVGMVAALAVVHFPHGDPFVAMSPAQPSYELGLTYLGIALMLLLVGPGRFSADYLLFGRVVPVDGLPAGAAAPNVGDRVLS
jgi:putative oxidoreductase